MLQGPNGPFFFRLARRFRALGSEVTKVHFNAGDALFWPRRGAIHYRAPMGAWEEFVANVLTERRIEAIVLFGQCRRHHLTAIDVARRLRVAVYVFEEGYMQPWWITLERDGANADSPLADVTVSKLPPAPELPSPVRFRFAFAKMAMYSFLYLLAGTLFKFAYPHCLHHRPFRWGEVVPWLRSGVRKWVYRVTERKALESLLEPPAGRYFLVPLQVQTDSQLRFHSAWNCNAEFIQHVISSFATHAPGYTRLAFRHDPMERGHTHYGEVIRALAAQIGVSERVVYIHDGHLPTLLRHARGVVVVNSTTGLEAMHHRTPVHACGRAFYDKPGLVSPGALDEFWGQPIPPLTESFTQFLRVINHYSQVNASFYVDGGLSDFRRHPPVLRPMSERVVAAANDEDFSERRPQPNRHEIEPTCRGAMRP